MAESLRKRFWKLKLRQKILISNLILFVLPCLFLSWQMVSFARQEGNQRLNQAKLVILNQINDSMDAMFTNIMTYSDFFFSNQEVNRLLSRSRFDSDYQAMALDKEVQDFIRDRWVLYGEQNYYLEILGENGRNYSSIYDENTPVSFSRLDMLKSESWYPALTENSRIQYIPSGYSEEFQRDGESAVRCVRLIKSFDTGKYIGLMDISIQRQQFISMFQAGIEKKGQAIFLVDQNGKSISTTDDQTTAWFLAFPGNSEKLLGYEQGYYLGRMEGKPAQVCFVTNPATGWKLVMCEAVSAGAWFNSRSMGIVVTAAVFFLLALLMSWYNSRYISRPVQKLKSDMQTVCKGNLSVRTEVETQDEFGQLSIQFNAMIGRIEELIGQLQEKDEEKRVLELQALQAQISPHFLYNTLASIRFLMEMDRNEQAAASLMALAKLLKRTFSDYRKLIPVKEELESLECYLVLMKNRYEDTFVWTIHMEKGTEDCLVPRISIQPLAENSILHGFGLKEGLGHIEILAHRQGDDLVISVRDDGEGADLDRIHHLLEDSVTVGQKGQEKGQVSGIGIRNVQERIQLFFGEQYGLTVRRPAGGGICFDMRMPAWTSGHPEMGERNKDEDHNC